MFVFDLAKNTNKIQEYKYKIEKNRDLSKVKTKPYCTILRPMIYSSLIIRLLRL